MFWKNCIQVAQNIWRLYEEKGGGQEKKERKSESQKLTRDILFKKGKEMLRKERNFFALFIKDSGDFLMSYFFLFNITAFKSE